MGRILSLLAVAFTSLFLFGYSGHTNSFSLFLIASAIMGLGGIIISWWRQLFASILLFLSSLMVGVIYCFGAQGWMIVSLVYLAAFILVFYSVLKTERKTVR